jgi:AraC-like DNA-binding protein
MTMEYVETPPGNALARWIRRYWMLRGDGGPPSAPAAVECVFPDGCVEIVLNLADPFVELSSGAPREQPAAMLVGPTTRPMRIGPSGRVDVIGIRFEPHGAGVALDLPPAEIVDRAPCLEDVARLPFRAWMERLAGTREWPARVEILESALLGSIRERRTAPFVRTATSLIAATDGRIPVDRLAVQVGVSRRRLERMFRSQVGLSPKTFSRIVRFHRFLGELRAGDPGLASAAVRCGYSDQSHLTRDFRSFTGTTPAAFLGDGDLLPRIFAGLPAP